MNKVSDIVLAILGVTLGIFLASSVGGIILFFVWPVAIPAVFPGLVSMGVLTPKLTIWTSICLTWAFNILFKTAQTTTRK